MKFKNGLTKAVTFSFDDGNIDDIRLVELISGKSDIWYCNNIEVIDEIDRL